MPSLKTLLAKLILPGRVLYRLPSPDTVYLTFDDGPNAGHTRAVLDVLDRHGARATFFMVGRDVHAHPELVDEVVRRGHRIGNHSLIHPRMDRMSAPARRLEIVGLDGVMAGWPSAYDGGWFRPPYGYASVGLIRQALGLGRRIVMWTRDSYDFKWGADEIVQGFVAEPPRAGDILLFHDDSPGAAPALDRLLPQWRARGLRLDALPANPL
jgi:peptidoglycan/xylan/chitin deacetylase (PgdA/CDA1 family)